MNFEAALQELKRGAKVQRTEWKVVGKWLELKDSDFYLCWPDFVKETVTRRARDISKEEVLAEDWEKLTPIGLRTNYEMTESDLVEFSEIFEANSEYLSLDTRICEAWKVLGEKKGFDQETVELSKKTNRFFTAIPCTPDQILSNKIKCEGREKLRQEIEEIEEISARIDKLIERRLHLLTKL